MYNTIFIYVQLQQYIIHNSGSGIFPHKIKKVSPSQFCSLEGVIKGNDEVEFSTVQLPILGFCFHKIRFIHPWLRFVWSEIKLCLQLDNISFKTSQLSRYQISAEKMDELPKTMKALRKETSSVGTELRKKGVLGLKGSNQLNHNLAHALTMKFGE